ncbi:unnamed protein product [Moneuplotes crassus]|uniref:PNPLA domain-containing protein n=1 Tax=Euplotes crassus TaxID=5936 RepID=A0AAD1XHG0_EUPCR|nr:unnamed protein product [Moneuplotes crassus]
MNIIIPFIVLLLSASVQGAPCRALVLEGGGDRGAYQAGAIRGMYEELGSNETTYDVISGISVGAVNAVAYSLYPPGEEEKATKWLMDFWKGMQRDKVFVNWPYYILEGVFYEGGIFDTSVFVDYVNSVVPTKDVQKKVSVGAVDSRTGQFVRFTEELEFDDLAFKATRGSAAIPGAFPPVEFRNMTLYDGGVAMMLDVAGAVDRCKETADVDEEITIDIVMCNGNTINKEDTSEYNSISNYLRFKEIRKYRESMRWIADALTNFPRVNFRYLVVPNKPLDNEWVPINFSEEHNERLMQRGIEDAKEVIREGPKKLYSEVEKYLSDVPTNPVQTEAFEGFTKRVKNNPMGISI